ncbi:MAG TPA: type II secretion system F family protein [Capsulimonadaceae bacterium]
MAIFTYNAVDQMGRAVKGSIEADNEQLVLTRLHEQHFHIVSIEEDKGGIKGILTARVGRVKLQHMVIFSRQFATMINAGINIIKCLDILENQTRDETLKTTIGAVRRDVKEGMTLCDAMSKHPNVFSKLYTNMIRAAEIGGILDSILDRLAGFLEKELEIKQKVKSALMYPIIVLIFAFLVVVALFVVVLPKFKEIFDSMNVEMPPTTQFLFDASDWTLKYWYVVVIIATSATIAVKQYARTEKGHYNIDKLKLKVPIAGDLVLKMGISRFARTFGTLLSSGVPMMRSLEIIGETSGNMVIAEAINKARTSIREGQKISAPLAQSGLFPPMVTHMIDVGEETGLLSEMLVKVSDFYDQEVDAMIKGLTSLIEPMLIVFMGVVVGFIAISVMSPIFKLVSNIH